MRFDRPRGLLAWSPPMRGLWLEAETIRLRDDLPRPQNVGRHNCQRQRQVFDEQVSGDGAERCGQLADPSLHPG